MKSHNNLSRRQFLGKSATALSGLAFSPMWFKYARSTQGETPLLGRVLFDDVIVFDRPASEGSPTGTYQYNDILTLSQPVKGLSPHARHEVWFPIPINGYIHSQNVQLVKNNLNEPRDDITPSGILGEITVPFAEAWPANKQKSSTNQLFFYGSIHWVYGLGEDQQGKRYYLVTEDRWSESYYVEATHMRILDDNELAPISPTDESEKKQIIVDTVLQMLYAYENDKLVMACGVSTGISTEEVNLVTPVGEYFINYKRPTRHMVHSDKIGINDGELYGVPWVSYFTNSGIAFHGTYWHNDFSQAKSHGCVNMPIQAAKWLYLWSDPIIEPRSKKHTSRYGTTVRVL